MKTAPEIEGIRKLLRAFIVKCKAREHNLSDVNRELRDWFRNEIWTAWLEDGEEEVG